MGSILEQTMRVYESGTAKYEAATADLLAFDEARRFASLLSHSDGKVLDVGCAYGRDVGLLASYGVRAVGVDSSRPFISRAKSLYPSHRFYVMDLRNLRFVDGAVSGVWCHAVLLHFPEDDLDRAMREINRVLKLGGVLFATFKEGYGVAEVVDDFSSDHVRFFAYYQIADVSRLLNEYGFSPINVYTVNEHERWGARDVNWIYSFSRKVKNFEAPR